MLRASLCLLGGAYALELMPHLPGWGGLVLAGLLALVLATHPATRTVALFVAGLTILGVAARLQLDDRLHVAYQSTDISLTATVIEFPTLQGDVANILVRPLAQPHLPARIRLSWISPERLPRLGETWRLEVRLRRPQGYMNPGGFDFEGWLFRNKVGATGYVVQDAHSYRIVGTPVAPIHRLRRQVVERLNDLLPGGDARAVLAAIAVGARHAISREQWDLYAATGTTHLMAISGLHIGLAAGVVYVLGWCVCAVVPGRRNIRDNALLAALVVAVLYAALSGFAVPARRACLMMSIAAAALLWRRELAAPALLAATAIVILITDPLSILTPGFKLSFAAVVILLVVARQVIVVTGRVWVARPVTGVLRLGMVQAALLVGLLPLTVTLFDRLAVIAPIVNFAVLPIFNFAAVPLAVLGALFGGVTAPVGDEILVLAHRSIEIVMSIVAFAESGAHLSYRIAVPVSIAVLMMPLTMVILPISWPGRRLAVLAALFVILAEAESPPTGCFDFHVLDVGQGLAVVINTNKHALLFDTGPSSRSGSTTFDLVVNPFLQHEGLDTLDAVMISHADLDHAGGVQAAISSTRVGRLYSGEVLTEFGRAQTPCVAGQTWFWDAIGFRVLHPGFETPWRGNNSSCVLEVFTGSRRLLLTGDIEKPVEILLSWRRAFRHSSVVVVPHHGSRTSSSPGLVDATVPEMAIVSAGRSNRWGFPKEDVAERWRHAGARVLSTAESGAVSQRLCSNTAPEPPLEARFERTKYWHDAAASTP